MIKYDIGTYGYLFTQGILGKIQDGKIVLTAGPFIFKTDYSDTYTDMCQLEKRFNINLVGIYYPDANYISRNLAIDELQATNDGSYWLFRTIVDDVGFALSEMRDILRILIFKNQAVADLLIDRLAPSIFADGGISEIPISRDQFEQLISNISWPDETYKYKLIYYFDVVALLDDFHNHFVNIGHRLLAVEYELHCYLSGILERDITFPKLNTQTEEDEYEYASKGWLTLKIHQQYMDCIIGLYSLLDVFSKVAFELYNLPVIYDRVIKLNSNGRYFTDLCRLEVPIDEKLDYKSTIFNKLEDYKELSILRNEFVHRSTLSPIPQIFFGQGTDIVNNEPVCYACCFLWDIDISGNPLRWKNRQRFYSQKTLIDQYILKWTKKVTVDLNCSVKYIKDQLILKKESIEIEHDVDISTISPSFSE